MKIRKFAIILLALFCPMVTGFAIEKGPGHVRAVFDKIASADNLAFDVTILLVMTDNASPTIVRQGRIRKQRESMLQEDAARKTLITRDAMVIVDLKRKTMRYFRLKKRGSVSGSNPIDAGWGQWKEDLQNFSYGGLFQGRHMYSRTNLPGVFRRVEVYISADTNRLSQIVYFYNPDYTGGVEKAVVEYTWHDVDLLDRTDFSLTQFIRLEGQHPKLSNSYSDFRLMLEEQIEK